MLKGEKDSKYFVTVFLKKVFCFVFLQKGMKAPNMIFFIKKSSEVLKKIFHKIFETRVK